MRDLASLQRVNDNIQAHHAYLGDRAKGRADAWSQGSPEFDSSTLPPRVTAIRRHDALTNIPAARSVPPAITRSNGKAGSTGERALQTIRRPAPVAVAAQTVAVVEPVVVTVEIVLDNPAELAAAQVRLLSVLKSRQAELEREEAAEAERIRIEAEAEKARRNAEAVELRKEQERLAREQAVLHNERGLLVEAFRTVDIEVFALLWPGTAFSRHQIIDWARDLDIAGVRNMQRHLTDKTAQHLAAKARAESARREAEARAAALNPKKKGFDLLAYLRSKAADPVVPVRPSPSKEELAELERKVNGLKSPVQPTKPSFRGQSGGKAGFAHRAVPSVPAQASPRELLEARIRALDVTLVARVYRGNNTRWRWPNIEAMLAVPSDDEANQKLGEFADKVEHAMAKAKRKG